MKRLFTLAFLFVLILLMGQLAFAQIPRTLSYQGILTDSLGVVKPDGDYTITFRLWDSETDGSWLWKEALSLTVKKGLFAAELGTVTPFPSTVKFDRPYWLSLQLAPEPELTPRLPLSSVAYSMSALATDSARIAGTVPNNAVTSNKLADGAVTSAKIADGTIQRSDLAGSFTVGRADTASFGQLSGTVLDNAITSAKILNGTIQLADLAQNGAGEGQVLKWAGGAWTVAADATGGGGTSGGGWTDNGAVVGLTTATDTVALNSSLRLGKLNLNGDIGLNGESGLYFGTRNSYLEALPGEHLTLHANRDLKLQSGNDLRLYGTGTMTILAGDHMNLGHYGDASWMKLDNTTKRVGIGMGASDAVDDRLHVKNDLAANCWVRIESAHPSSWGQAGLRIKTPQNQWNLRMDTPSNTNIPNGGLALYSSDGGVEAMTWLEDGKVGVGTKNPIRKLHVNGSVEVNDTLYAGTINAGKIVNGTGVVHVRRSTKTLGDSYAPIDSLTVNAPGPGYILLFFSGTLYSDHTFADRTYVRMSITTGRDGSGNLGKVEWQVDVQNPSAYCQIPMAVQGVMQVASKGSYEFFAGGHSAVGTVYTPDRVTAQNIAFTALFVPAAYGTVEASPPPDPPPLDDVAARMDEPRRTDNSLESEVLALKQELQAIKKQLDSNRK